MRKMNLLTIAVTSVVLAGSIFSEGTGIGTVSAATDEVKFSEDGIWLPDPGNIFGVKAEFYDVITGENDVTYASYLYTFDSTTDEMGEMLFTYETVLMDLDCSVKQYKLPDKAVRYEGYFCDDAAAAELVVYIKDNAKELSEGGTGTFLVGLMIPVDDWYFETGKYSNQVKNGGLRCSECGGTGLCRYCGGTGSANYGDGYETCIICDGSGVCNICDGVGSY